MKIKWQFADKSKNIDTGRELLELLENVTRVLLFLSHSVQCQGSPASWKVLDFLLDFPGLESPGKSVWSWKVWKWKLSPGKYWKMNIVERSWIYWGFKITCSATVAFAYLQFSVRSSTASCCNWKLLICFLQYIEHHVLISVTEQFPSNFYLWWTFCFGLHSVCTLTAVWLYILTLVGSMKVLEKRFDGPGKVLEFFYH